MAKEEKDTRSPQPKPPLPVRRFDVPPMRAMFVGHHSDELIEQVSRHQLVYSICGLVLGSLCVIGGLALFLAGVTGKMSWTAKFLGASSEILDAAPGAVLFIVGLFVVFVTRYVLKSSR